jgi:regulator of sirC expression with transglutaminase-like and TPR domain
VYDGGTALSKDDAEKKVRNITSRPLAKEDLIATTKRAIVVRMLHNLLGVARGERDGESMLRYLDAILTLAPDAGADRWLRAQLRYHAGQKEACLTDVEWLIDKQPVGVEREAVLELRKLLTRE